ncbi:MAG: LD-carboxypeptidase [Acidobacteria bacterium]|nr:LD-carboxypeptidase [Acidobacteriota bacterium]
MASKKTVRKPIALRRGDAIGLVAPASPVDRRRLDEGIRELEAIGYRVVCHPQTLARQEFYAGPHADRVQALLAQLEDPGIRAVFCARGGYGSNYVVEQLSQRSNLQRLQRLTPKIVMGYSDITTLLTFLSQTLGWVTFQGPMLTKDLASGETGYERTMMEKMLADVVRGYHLESDAVVLRPGTATGWLAGGCLSLLVATLGTPQEIATAGSILLLEDVDEKPYRIDRMLFQLRRAGKFKDIKGVIFGEMPGCTLGPPPHEVLHNVILQAFEGMNIPIAFGMRFGHNSGHCLTLPLGIRAKLEADATVKLTTLEPAVRAAEKKSKTTHKSAKKKPK